jgi:hypothetical protein
MAAVRHGDYVAKIRLAPASENTTRTIHCELDLRVRPEVFWLMNCRPALSISTSRSSCARISRPVNDVTVEWPEELSPFVTVGRVHIPRQDISRAENFEKTDALAFNQWRVTEEHRPLGEIMQVR